MTKLNHERLNKLKRGVTSTMAESSVVDFQPIRSALSHDPFTKWCLKCRKPFEYAGLDERGPLIKCCMDCRVDLEQEARLNGLDPNLADDILVRTIKQIAATELVIVEQARLAHRSRTAGNRARADHHRNRMVLASKHKQHLIARLA